MAQWTCVLKLNQAREVVTGSPEGMCDAVRSGADLRVGTTFRHNEHIDPSSTNDELVREVISERPALLNAAPLGRVLDTLVRGAPRLECSDDAERRLSHAIAQALGPSHVQLGGGR